MSIMVTGIGHVGGYIVRDLIALGEKVVLFGLFGGRDSSDTTSPDLEVLAHLVGEDYTDKVEIVVGDVRDLDALLTTARKYRVTKVIHLATILSASAEAHPRDAVEVNSIGSTNIFEMAAQLSFEKVVWASSIDVFGDRSVNSDGVITDDAVYDPAYIYGATKVLDEYIARRYAAAHDLSITGLRLSRVYGFGEHIKAGRGGGSSWLSGLLHEPAVGSGKEVVVPFGDRMMDFIYVEDIADAFIKALNTLTPGSNNYLTRGTHRRVSEVFDYVRSLFPDAPLTLQREDAPLPAGSSMVWRNKFDGTRASEEIGFTARFSLEEGVLRTINANRAIAGLPPVEPATV